MCGGRSDGVANRIEVQGLGKAYNDRWLFRDLDIIIPDNSVMAVQGPNGSGKTTLLYILCGLVAASSGYINIVLEDREVTQAQKRMQLGLVSPELRLYEGLSAVENLEFFCAVRGLPFSLLRARELLEFVGLAKRGRDFVGNFSSGMKQRLKYACALWHRPHILVLDEPTSHLDEKGAQLVEQIILEQRRRGMVVLATNEPAEIKFGDQSLVLV